LASPLYLSLKTGKSRKEVSPKEFPCAEPCLLDFSRFQVLFSGEFCLPQFDPEFFVTPDLLEIDWSRFWVGQQLHVKEKDKQETRVVNAFPKLHKNLRSIISCVWLHTGG
jgi:hypothetical protein